MRLAEVAYGEIREKHSAGLGETTDPMPCRPGAQQQRQLLETEGILFVKDKIDLKAYQWRGPGQEQRPRQARLF